MTISLIHFASEVNVFNAHLSNNLLCLKLKHGNNSQFLIKTITEFLKLIGH